MHPALLLVALADRPVLLGRYADWAAAAHRESGQIVCYAFTRAAPPSFAVLSVAQRPTERDDVAIAEPFAFRRDATMWLQVGAGRFDFYLAPRAGFARNGPALASTLSTAPVAVDHTQDPQGAPLSDQFSLRGFPDAYAAIARACPES